MKEIEQEEKEDEDSSASGGEASADDDSDGSEAGDEEGSDGSDQAASEEDENPAQEVRPLKSCLRATINNMNRTSSSLNTAVGRHPARRSSKQPIALYSPV